MKNFFELFNKKNPNLELEVEELSNKAINFHDNFNKSKWRKDKSFHNSDHIRACLQACEILVKKAMMGEDPLRIKEDLERWNQNQRSNISLDEFLLIITLAYSFHDLGNIADLQNGKIVFLNTYTSNQAEERSKRIAEYLIRESKLPQDKKKRWLDLILYLIEETKFQIQDPQRPFALLVRFIDQIGGNLFNQNRNRIFGLILELVEEKGEISINPYEFFNFVNLQARKLLNDPNVLEKVLEIWGKRLPELDNRYPNTIIILNKENVLDFISSLPS